MARFCEKRKDSPSQREWRSRGFVACSFIQLLSIVFGRSTRTQKRQKLYKFTLFVLVYSLTQEDTIRSKQWKKNLFVFCSFAHFHEICHNHLTKNAIFVPSAFFSPIGAKCKKVQQAKKNYFLNFLNFLGGGPICQDIWFCTTRCTSANAFFVKSCAPDASTDHKNR